jgi:hypothetical protein
LKPTGWRDPTRRDERHIVLPEAAAEPTLSGVRQSVLRIVRNRCSPGLATGRHEATASSWHDNFLLCNQGEPATKKLPHAQWRDPRPVFKGLEGEERTDWLHEAIAAKRLPARFVWCHANTRGMIVFRAIFDDATICVARSCNPLK